METGNLHRLPARKSLGQNFIIDPNIVGRIIDEADIGPEDTVVEIGPGQGAMTRGLAERAKHLIAIELDERLLHRLKTELSDLKNIDLILGNALTFPYERLIGKVKVVANLPYYISSPMITRLIEVREKIDYLILMLQKEVAERITAPPGGKEYGYLSVMVQLWAGAEILFHVPREAFSPVPKVDSAVVRLRMRASPEVEAADYGFFGKIVGAAFSQRRKTLRNTLRASGLIPPEAFDTAMSRMAEAGIDPSRRAETLSIGEFGMLAEILFELSPAR